MAKKHNDRKARARRASIALRNLGSEIAYLLRYENAVQMGLDNSARLVRLAPKLERVAATIRVVHASHRASSKSGQLAARTRGVGKPTPPEPRPAA